MYHIHHLNQSHNNSYHLSLTTWTSGEYWTWCVITWGLILIFDGCQIQAGFYLGFIIWGRSPEWPKMTSFPPPPPEILWNEYAMRCNLVHNFWDTILRNVTVCALTSSRLDDFFRYSYLYTVMITIFWGVKLLPLKYPR